jgi:hypothetical protein
MVPENLAGACTFLLICGLLKIQADSWTLSLAHVLGYNCDDYRSVARHCCPANLCTLVAC